MMAEASYCDCNKERKHKPNYTIKIGEKEYKVDITMLSKNSSYFRRTHLEHSKQGKPKVIDLTNVVESRIFEIILRYIYIGKGELSRDKFSYRDSVQVLEAADILEIGSLEKDLSSARKPRQSEIPYHVEKYKDYKEGRHTDCIIKIGEKEYKAHRNMFFVMSCYLSRIMIELFKQRKPVVVDLTNLIESRIFEIIIRYIYIGEIELSPDKITLDDLILITKAALFLKMPELYEECTASIDQLMSSLKELKLDEEPSDW